MYFDPARIAARREALEMTREELSVAAGIPYGTLTTIELGYNEPKVNAVAAIAAALKIPLPPELFADEPVQIGRPAAGGGSR